ncbi:DUF7305 domain-containing protein [Lederbergia citrea]|uniref:Type 4 fimbrial biogenesis protein PilX N-terminal domain-containing protein n=1 Tax=Lederbergia citrea TaxID=2833581 RepID=A0A942Z5S5_9BACI|nr:PilX N-terminal domain-containing pilus assembly protein [Lederbergia citrea]MBS4177850.1 hypothetical protein [Lederbergia citrea]MBS4204524.1 hypothetical protein [Lederbergia citrea]MBS4223632.1 hypothetical protein [Lederbergia citrea]
MNREVTIRKQLANESGGSLVFVLLVLVMFTILGMSLLALGINNVKMSAGERKDQSTYYIAEAGIVQSMSDIKKGVREIKAKTENEFYAKADSFFASLPPPTFEENFGSQPTADVWVKKEAEKGAYTVKSKGKIDNKIRMLERRFKVTWSGKATENPGDGGYNPSKNLPKDLAVLMKGNINLSRGATINGKVATTLAANVNPITISGGAKIDGGITYGETAYSFNLPAFPKFPQYPIPANKEIKNSSGNSYWVINNGNLLIDSYISDNYRLILNENMAFKEIKLTNNYTLTIDIGNADKAIVVDELNVINGHIKIIGTGKLTIYVNGNITMGSGSTINGGQSFNKLNVFLKGTGDTSKPKSVKLAGDQKVYASLYAEDANIEIGRGGGFQGHIFTGGKTVKIDGGGSGNPAFIFAPNAEFTLNGGGTIKGTIIGKSMVADGGTSVSYEAIDLSSLPFFPINPGGEFGVGEVIELGGTIEE